TRGTDVDVLGLRTLPVGRAASSLSHPAAPPNASDHTRIGTSGRPRGMGAYSLLVTGGRSARPRVVARDAPDLGVSNLGRLSVSPARPRRHLSRRLARPWRAPRMPAVTPETVRLLVAPRVAWSSSAHRAGAYRSPLCLSSGSGDRKSLGPCGSARPG